MAHLNGGMPPVGSPHKSRGKEVSKDMISFISNFVAYLQNRRDDEEGQTLVEYGLLLALIAIVVIAVLVLLGPAISGIFQDVQDQL